MRILLFPSSYAPVVGGLQTVVQTLAKYLHEQQHEVRIVTNRYPVSLKATENIDGVRVDRLLLLQPRVDQLRRNRHDLFLASLYYGPASFRRLRNIFKQFRPDVVNVHFPDHQIPFILKLRSQFDFRLIVSLHGHDVERNFADNHSGNENGALSQSAIALRSILKQADAVTAVSRHLLDRACLVEPAIADKSHVIYNGINPARFEESKSYSHKRPYILGLGRLTYTKGFDLLVEAFAKADARKQFELIIAGAGEEEQALKRQAEQLGLENDVHFLGSVSADQVVKLINGCSVVTVPSRKEAFGIVALEAFAAGKPVLATAIGGLKELFDVLTKNSSANADYPNITLAKPTVQSLASNLSQMLEPARNEMTRQNGFKLPRIFTNQYVGSSYERVMSNS
jgi:glycosyltransferase involved in cell wall biosynthesis